MTLPGDPFEAVFGTIDEIWTTEEAYEALEAEYLAAQPTKPAHGPGAEGQ